VGPGAHVIHYPLRQGKLVNFVGILERDDWQVESWTERGSVQECARDFAGWHEDVQTLIQALDEPYKWALMLREPLPVWSLRRVTLLGDACHPTLPMLASGAAMAIEDGYVLARALEAHPDDIPLAFKRYEAVRVGAGLARGARLGRKRPAFPQTPRWSTHRAPPTTWTARWNEARVRERYEWLFSYNADEAPV
jgi:salicylate hydroxylase